MLNIIKWIIGVTFLVMQPVGSEVTLNDCRCDDKMNKTSAACYCANSVTLPSNLDENLQVFSILIYKTNNESLKFEKEHLMRFVHLKQLTVTATTVPGLEISNDLLKPLTALEMLDITYLQVKPPEIPVSVKVLIATSIENSSHPDMSALENLEKLIFKSNFIDDFPKLSEVAPLYELDLTGNPLRRMTYHDLAPYCLLRNLILTGTLVERDPDKCCGIKTWIRDTNITSEVHCGEADAKCDEKVKGHDDEADRVYYDCLSRTGQFETTTAMEYFFQAMFSLALILALSYLVYRYYGSRAVKTFRESRKVTDLPKLNYVEEEEEPEEITKL